MFTCGPGFYEGITAAHDPFYSYVKILLLGQGTVGSSVITDSSPVARTMTAGTSATISSGRYMGNSSIYNNGTSYVAKTAPAADLYLNTQQFCAEAWVFTLNTSTQAIYIGQADLATNAGSAEVFYIGPGSSTSDMYVGGGRVAVASPTPEPFVWHHVCWERDATNTYRSYLDGAVVDSTSAAVTVNDGSTAYMPAVGGFANGSFPYSGYIHFRLTIGVARYGGAFTPPAVFPSS